MRRVSDGRGKCDTLSFQNIRHPNVVVVDVIFWLDLNKRLNASI